MLGRMRMLSRKGSLRRLSRILSISVLGLLSSLSVYSNTFPASELNKYREAIHVDDDIRSYTRFTNELKSGSKGVLSIDKSLGHQKMGGYVSYDELEVDGVVFGAAKWEGYYIPPARSLSGINVQAARAEFGENCRQAWIQNGGLTGGACMSSWVADFDFHVQTSGARGCFFVTGLVNDEATCRAEDFQQAAEQLCEESGVQRYGENFDTFYPLGVKAYYIGFNADKLRFECYDNKLENEQENLGDDDCNTGKKVGGNPIDIATGNKYQSETDYVGSGRLPLVVMRSYNSFEDIESEFGRKWRSNHQAVILVNEYTTNTTTNEQEASVVTIIKEDGEGVELTLGSDDVWRNASDKAFDLRYIEAEGVWCFVDGGRIRKFDGEHGYLVSVEEPYGEKLTYSYDAESRLTQVQKNTGQSMSLSYKSSGLINYITLPGMTVTYFHDSSERLTQVQYSSSTMTHSKHYTYDSLGSGARLRSITDENGDVFASWEYESDSDVARVSYHGNNQERFEILDRTEYETNGVKYRDVVTKNANDKQTTYTFKRVGERWQSTGVTGHAAGTCAAASQSTTYDILGYVNTTTDWQGNVTDYDYDAEGRILKVVSGKGGANEQTTTMTWDTNLNLPDVTTTDTAIIDNDYDARGRLIQTRVTDRITNEVRTSSISYTDFANGLMKTMTVDGPRSDVNDVVTTEYNSSGHIIKITNALGHITQFSDYNDRGQAQTITHADGRVDKLTYHSRGWLLKRENDVNGQKRTSTFIYDKVGQIKSQTIQGVQTSFEYDNAHRLTKELYFTDSWDFGGSYYNQPSQTDYPIDIYNDAFDVQQLQQLANNQPTMSQHERYYTYDSASNVIRENVRRGEVSHQVCSDAEAMEYREYLAGQSGTSSGNLDIQVVPLGYQGYDDQNNFGDLCQVQAVEESRQMNYSYDALNRLTQSTSGMTVKYRYNTNNQVTEVEDAKGNISTNTYDDLGRLISSTNREGNTTSYTYNHLDQVIATTDPKGNTTTYVYNGFGEITSQSSPDTGLTTFVYNSAGQMTSRQNANGINTSYQYDASGRVTREDIGNNITRTYEYDTQRIGYLYRMTDESGSQMYTVNAHGQLTQRTDSITGASFTTQWSYNSNGFLTQIIHPNGFVKKIGYGLNGQLHGIGGSANGGYWHLFLYMPTYLPFGPMESYAANNMQVIKSKVYDGDYNLKAYGSNHSGNGGIFQHWLDYDANLNITGFKPQNPNMGSSSPTKSYTYDAMDRVTTLNEYNQNTSFNFDANGNRTHQNNAAIYNVDSNSNRLLSHSGTSLVYDNNGNIIQQGNKHYYYNDANRMTSFSQGSTSATYTYNANQQRAKKVTNGQTTYFVYGQGGELIYEQQGSEQRNYIYNGLDLIGMVKNNQIYTIHSDHLGRPEVVTNTNDQPVWQAQNKAFDRTVLFDQIGGLNIGFPGQYWDSEKGSWYNHHRDYDANLGRYLQSDPLGLVAGINTYGYVSHNPLRAVDPSGLIGLGGGGDWILDGIAEYTMEQARNAPPSSAFQSTVEMSFDWLFGTGPDLRIFGPDSPHIDNLRNIQAVRDAVEWYESKNQSSLDSLNCDGLVPVDNYRSSFGASGYTDAWLDLNPTWHFVGSFSIEVDPISLNEIKITLRNTSSFESFFYGMASNWERSSFAPMGNMRQEYWWTETIN